MESDSTAGGPCAHEQARSAAFTPFQHPDRMVAKADWQPVRPPGFRLCCWATCRLRDFGYTGPMSQLFPATMTVKVAPGGTQSNGQCRGIGVAHFGPPFQGLITGWERTQGVAGLSHVGLSARRTGTRLGKGRCGSSATLRRGLQSASTSFCLATFKRRKRRAPSLAV
jgi:hypothetical protein